MAHTYEKKIRVGVLFGGCSAEHEVSLVSAESIMKNLDRQKYQVIPIGIDKQGRWLRGQKALKYLKIGKSFKYHVNQSLSPEAMEKHVDVIFPVMHGTFGEDGTMQGLLELARVPYVGAGVLGSAVGMDKIIQKLIYQAEKILTPEFQYFTKYEFVKSSLIILRHLKKLGLPVFVKPANLGSSIGISKVKRGSDLKKSIALAFKYDHRILVEKAVPEALEIELAVLGNDEILVSGPGQIIPSNEFYDYNAKYVDSKSKAVIPAPLPAATILQLRSMAAKAYKALDLAGMARIDFLVSKPSYKVYLNEVNTIPGFTAISMYPKLWAASGLSYVKLLDILINLAIKRFKEKNSLVTSYHPKSKWYS